MGEYLIAGLFNQLVKPPNSNKSNHENFTSTQVLTRSAILDKLWEFDNLAGEGTVRTHITNLRQKLKAAGSKDLIETIYGVGYRLGSLD